MAKPSYVYKWCEEETDIDGNLSRIAPPPEVELTGTLSRQPVFRLWFNEMQYNFSNWIQYLTNERDPVGSLQIVETGTFADDAEASSQWGGTWVTQGTDTIGTVASTVYKKTSL